MKRIPVSRHLPTFGLLFSFLVATVGTASAEFLQQGPKLVGAGSSGAAAQGSAIAISADGNTAVVGAPGDASGYGAVYIFVRSNGAWTQQGGKLVGAGVIGSGVPLQGEAVAISADGNTVIAGGHYDNSSAGAAWIFVRNNGVWSGQGKLVGSGAIGAAGRGSSVALSADGSTALVGGPYDNGNKGAAWVFTRTGSSWTQQGTKLVGAGAVGDARQGIAVALSGDGNTALIGGDVDNDLGATWVFNRNAGAWSQFGNKLVGSGNVGYAAQGRQVALSADGKTAAIGGDNDALSPNGAPGATWIFTFDGSAWAQQGSKLTATDATGVASQGGAVSLSRDGDTLLVGGSADGGGAGAVWIYGRVNGVWTQRGQKITGTGRVGSETQQGSAASLSADGSTAIVGGPGDNSSVGASWVFSRLVPHDFALDGKSDILWRNTAGDLYQWTMNGASATAVTSLGSVGTSFSMVGQRDFDGDGKADILWRDTSGNVIMWLMNGTTAASVTSLGNVSTNWSVVGTTDVNRNNRGDILWRNTAGDTVMWSMLGASASQIFNFGNIPPNWNVIAVADFNGDDRGDILWRTNDGYLAMWVMGVGGSIASVNSLGFLGTNWSLAGTADFDGDGKVDLLWRENGGSNAIWRMNGAAIAASNLIGGVAPSWSVAAVGDYNGDGKGDIVWRNTGGDNYLWFMNGTAVTSVVSLGNVPPNWTLQNANAN